ncbi:[FeFe] hydrogenase H-cluster maturation GTPase HydF [Soehngenia longivitae]|uniref:[FeFe] hydrogenase H-cluster maturation GTPase HydF n=1 Tax=Soehngenia longivitae TaxID=2562294 RepID=A0A4Z0D917_9FIRM|nr:[FeFe] hydrogenase H-cluster maturation GTPase HydF [Soehngenia longivitae]TFZ41389.1 [FeFe] hydrogenase H-cluster maturation GTPase HydF [Soehngenia longivitae]
MEKTPNSNRVTISIFGNRNAGKSSLLNAIANQEVSIVSDVKGTTTDPVKKAMELIPAGPVLFIDTAGIDDEGNLGNLRIKKSFQILRRTDIALYIIDGLDEDDKNLENIETESKYYDIPLLKVVNKTDLLDEESIVKLKDKYPDAIFISTKNENDIELLKAKLIALIQSIDEDKPIVGDMLKPDSNVILVIPIDKLAPKGRIILPQVQTLRDLLDHGIKSFVVRNTELENALKDIKKVDLVITDSQVFKEVDEIVPKNIPLTSFSILFARQKGELNEFVKGVRAIEKLNQNSRVLIAENCTHNTNHEDIGRKKIPDLIRQKTFSDIQFDFKSGYDFEENLSDYDLIIHCGGCMVNRREILSRIRLAKQANVPITNYGITMAYLTGILDRSIELFKERV